MVIAEHAGLSIPSLPWPQPRRTARTRGSPTPVPHRHPRFARPDPCAGCPASYRYRRSVSRAFLQADLLAANARCTRLAAQVRRLEARLSEALGERVWRESGIGGPDDAEQLKARITTLEQQVADVEIKLQKRDDDLVAARAANRELMAQLNGTHQY